MDVITPTSVVLHIGTHKTGSSSLQQFLRDQDAGVLAAAAAIVERGIELRAMTSPDNNLGAVFEYLTGGRGGGADE